MVHAEQSRAPNFGIALPKSVAPAGAQRPHSRSPLKAGFGVDSFAAAMLVRRRGMRSPLSRNAVHTLSVVPSVVRNSWMKELKLNPVDLPALSDEVYALALARIDAVMGCTENSPEEAELVLWAEIADAHERPSGSVNAATAGLAVHQPAGNKE